MSSDRKSRATTADTARDAQRLMRCALKASLATLDKEKGFPYASLITVGTEPDASPVFLISTLALHTQNIARDNRISILFDGTDGLGDPLQGGRVSVFGRAEKTEAPSARARFLSRHPESEFYADFRDFAFYRLAVEGAHFVGGFGRIHDIAPENLLTDTSRAAPLIEAEPDIVEHMNADHADAVALYATRLLGAEGGPWRLTGCDPEGCDLVLGTRTLRLEFPEPVTSTQAIRETLVAMAARARETSAPKT